MNLRAIEWKILVPTDARISNCQQYPARQTPTTRQALKSLRSAKTQRTSFVGSGSFYSIFQHTNGDRPHSMACGGQHS